MEASFRAWYNRGNRKRDRFLFVPIICSLHLESPMAKPHRGLKKANHGARPANSKARKAKRKHIKT